MAEIRTKAATDDYRRGFDAIWGSQRREGAEQTEQPSEQIVQPTPEQVASIAKEHSGEIPLIGWQCYEETAGPLVLDLEGGNISKEDLVVGMQVHVPTIHGHPALATVQQDEHGEFYWENDSNAGTFDFDSKGNCCSPTAINKKAVEKVNG